MAWRKMAAAQFLPWASLALAREYQKEDAAETIFGKKFEVGRPFKS